jgi:hypothetical protein
MDNENIVTYSDEEAKVLETQGLFVNLFGKSLLIADDANMQKKDTREFKDRQKMKFEFDEVSSDYTGIIKKANEYDFIAVHAQVLYSDDLKRIMKELEELRTTNSHLIILEGAPVIQEDIPFYKELREKGFQVVNKYDSQEIAAKLSEISYSNK